MKRAILLTMALLLVATMSYAHCGTCGIGDAKIEGHDHEDMAAVVEEVEEVALAEGEVAAAGEMAAVVVTEEAAEEGDEVVAAAVEGEAVVVVDEAVEVADEATEMVAEDVAEEVAEEVVEGK